MVTAPLSEDPRPALSTRLEELQRSQIELPYLECGAETYDWVMEMLLAHEDEDKVDSMREQFNDGRLQVSFGGVLVRRCDDVPERTFWPPRINRWG